MTLLDFREAEVSGRTVLVRADLNVAPVGGRTADRAQIARLAGTVAALRSRGATVVVMGHLGQPNGIANPVLSLAPVAAALADELGCEVIFVPDCVGAVAEATTRSLPQGAVAMLENLRFHAAEQAGDRSFAMLLSVHGDTYVNDAFLPDYYGAPASIGAITELMPSYAGPALLGGGLPDIVGSSSQNNVTEDI